MPSDINGYPSAHGQTVAGVRQPIQTDSGGRLIPGEDITELTFEQDLSAAVLDAVTAIGADFGLVAVFFAASVVITETITVTLDANAGVTYDTVLFQWNWMNQRYQFIAFEPAIPLLNGNEIRVQCTDNGGAGIIRGIIETVTR